MQPSGPIIKDQLIKKKNTSITIHNLRCQILKKLDFSFMYPNNPDLQSLTSCWPPQLATTTTNAVTKIPRWVCWRDLLDQRDCGGLAPKMAQAQPTFVNMISLFPWCFNFLGFFFFGGFWGSFYCLAFVIFCLFLVSSWLHLRFWYIVLMSLI